MCPRTKEQNDRIRESRMKQIAAAAADVWLEKGHALEIRDVALRAGLGYGTVYHYYPNKFRLLDDMLNEAAESAADATRSVFAEGSRKPPLLERYAGTMLSLWASDRSTFILYKLALENYRELPSAEARRLDERFQTELYAPLTEAVLLEADCGPEEADRLAGVLLASLAGCAGLHLYRGQFDFADSGMAGMLVKGILAGKERQPK